MGEGTIYQFSGHFDELRELLGQAGFQVVSWRDTSEEGRSWFREVAEKMQKVGGTPPLGFHILLGPDFKTMARNQVRNLNENRIGLIEAVGTTPIQLNCTFYCRQWVLNKSVQLMGDSVSFFPVRVSRACHPPLTPVVQIPASMYLEANEKRPTTTYWGRTFRLKAVSEL